MQVAMAVESRDGSRSSSWVLGATKATGGQVSGTGWVEACISSLQAAMLVIEFSISVEGSSLS